MEAAGETFDFVGAGDNLLKSGSSLVEGLLKLWVCEVDSRPVRPGEQGLVLLSPAGITGSGEQSWEPFDDWLAATLVLRDTQFDHGSGRANDDEMAIWWSLGVPPAWLRCRAWPG